MIQQFDYLGKEVKPGDYVVTASGYLSELRTLRVVKVTKKMVRCEPITAPRKVKKTMYYSKDLIRVAESDVTFRVLKEKNT